MPQEFENNLSELENNIKNLIDEFHKKHPVWISRIEYCKPARMDEQGKIITYMYMGSGAGWPMEK